MNDRCQFNCGLCNYLYRNNAVQSAGIFICVLYDNQLTVLAGKETDGNYKNLYNVPGGKMDPEDRGCYKKCAIRELKEELKIYLTNKRFHQLFSYYDGRGTKYRIFMCGRTPIFYTTELPISLKDINLNLRKALYSDKADKYREISKVQLFNLNDGQSIFNMHDKPSSYLLKAINEFNKQVFDEKIEIQE